MTADRCCAAAGPSSPAEAVLTIDCGNSTIDCLEHHTGRRLRWHHGEDPGPLAAFLTLTQADRCAGVAVRHAEEFARCATWLGQKGLRLWRAGVDGPCPLPLDYATPHTLGADRWLGALAAHRRFGAALVVDCGSATTVNLVDAQGVFRGGPIAPGLAAFRAGMAAVTPVLPAADLQATLEVPPRSSQAAVDCGVLLGYCGMVERLVAELLRAARAPTTVVVTGGHAERLLSHTRLALIHEPALVHLGLRQWLREVPCGG
jgi:pantothenate kinase type III